MLIFALALAAPTSASLSDIHQRDIACIAVMALIANDQRRKAEGYDLYPDVQENGKIWAGIVGERVMEQTGLPKEIVGIAMNEAAKNEQDRVATADEPRSVAMNRFLDCQPIMEADLAIPHEVILPAKGMPPIEIDWGTDEPEKIARYKAELTEDWSDINHTRYCGGLLRATHAEIKKREGVDSRDARAIGRLAEGIGLHVATFPLPEPGSVKSGSLDALLKDLDAMNEPSGEKKMARCIRLGEATAKLYGI